MYSLKHLSQNALMVWADRDPMYLALSLFWVLMICKILLNFVFLDFSSGDLSIFVQMFYHSLHGEFFYNSFESHNHLAIHFSPILILLIPLMAVAQSVPLLMIFNVSMYVSGLAWLYVHVKKTNPVGALLVVLILMTHTTLIYEVSHDFHELALMILPFIGALISFRERRFKAFIWWLLVLATLRENIYLTLLSWSAICLWYRYERRWVLGALGLAVLHYLVANLFMPKFFGEGLRPSLLNSFQAYGSGASEILSNLVADPSRVCPYLFSEAKFRYLKHILVPFLLILPFFRVWFLPALPTLILVLFSTHGRLDDPHLHYSVEVVMWFAASTLQLLDDKKQQLGLLQKPVKLFILLHIVLMLVAITQKTQAIRRGYGGQRFQALQAISQHIDPNASLVARRYLANYLSWREKIWFLSETESAAAWSDKDLLLLEEQDRDRAPQGWLLIRQDPPFYLYAPDLAVPSSGMP